jgi:hypothetical protein
LFAVSILLTAVFHKFPNTIEALDHLFRHIDRAIAVLQAMDECIVARNATSIIKRALGRAKKVPRPGFDVQAQNLHQRGGMVTAIWDAANMGGSGSSATLPSSAAAIEENASNILDDELNWLDAFPFDDGQQALFWTEWAHELNVLGT